MFREKDKGIEAALKVLLLRENHTMDLLMEELREQRKFMGQLLDRLMARNLPEFTMAREVEAPTQEMHLPPDLDMFTGEFMDEDLTDG